MWLVIIKTVIIFMSVIPVVTETMGSVLRASGTTEGFSRDPFQLKYLFANTFVSEVEKQLERGHFCYK